MSSVRCILLALFAALVQPTKGHGFLVFPPLRGGTVGSTLNNWCPHCGNGQSVCGDGGQWGSSSDFLGRGESPQATFTAGSVVEFQVTVTAHHKGHFEFSICDQQLGRATADPEGCLNRHRLHRTSPPTDCVPNDSRGDCQPLDTRYPERWYLPPGVGTYKMRFQIPQDLSSSTCTLQWTWWTANSCTPAPDYGCYFSRMKSLGWDAAAWCGAFCGTCTSGAALLESNTSQATTGCGEEFRNCADIAVVGGSAQQPAPAPATSTATTTTTTSRSVASSTPAPTPSTSKTITVATTVKTTPAPSATTSARTTPTPVPTPAPTPAWSPAAGKCVRNLDCIANPWCNDASYDSWCGSQDPAKCPSPQCKLPQASTTLTSTRVAKVTTVTTTPALGPVVVCVPQSVLTCINDYSSYWPKCSPNQTKSNAGPAGYEFGYYCAKEWVASLNEVLSDPQVGKCRDTEAIRRFLAQVAYETGYYSTVYQPRDGGAGLIHMIPANWPSNAQDMDALWPGQQYAQKATSMGKGFFQTAAFGWRSVAAWFKRTNRVIGGCGLDLFGQPYDTQTKCILGSVVDRSEPYNVVGRCMAAHMPPATASVLQVGRHKSRKRSFLGTVLLQVKGALASAVASEGQAREL